MQQVDVSPQQSAPLRFGRFELQPQERRLLVDGQPANLGARAFDLLATLAARPGRLVSKNELLDLVWPGLIVEEANLHTQISTLRKVLGGEIIATVPGRGYRFTAAAQAAASGSPAAPLAAAPVRGLPATAGRLIGRDDDLARLEAALREPGCVTLVGAGGVGKTRLALAAAQRCDARPVWVDLAPLAEGVQIEGAVARALGLPLADGDAGAQLLRGLGAEPVLLVLDNAEHLVDACSALVNMLLAGLPQLRALVTSQLALALAGERVLRIEPLAIETADAAPSAGDGAIALLVERIAAADHRVRIEPASTPLLREICSQLDALPLALEMAAARVPLLGLKGVRDELAQRFSLLTTGHRQAAQRHRTLHGALDWSFGLLGTDEQRLFAALGVFAGGFTLDLCVALVGDDTAVRWEVIDRLAVLVDRSLVAVSSDDPPRYRLLETMRAYALEKLAASGAEPTLRRRHAEVLLAFFAGHSSEDNDRAMCLPELDNMREAIVWTRANAPALAVELSLLTASVTTFSPWRGQSHAWMSALEPLMLAPPAESFGLELQVRWWNEFARSSINSMSERAADVARRARALARTLDDPLALYLATVALVRALWETGAELDHACADLDALLAAHPQWPARRRLMGQGALAIAAGRRGDLEGLLAASRLEHAVAREAGSEMSADAAETRIAAALSALGRHEEALARSNALVQRLQGSRSANLAWAWEALLTALLDLGRVDEARTQLPRALAACREFDLPICLPALVQVALLRNRPHAAAQLIGHTRQAFEQRGIGMYVFEEKLAALVADVRKALGDEEADRLAREGLRLDEAQAIELGCGG